MVYKRRKSIVESIKSLGSLLNRGHSSNAATVAAAALSQICQADPKSKELVRECGGVKALSKLINTGVASDASGVRKRGQDLANWCDGKACEAIATTMHQIVNVNGCPRIIRDEGCAAAARRHHPRITRQRHELKHNAGNVYMRMRMHMHTAHLRRLSSESRQSWRLHPWALHLPSP